MERWTVFDYSFTGVKFEPDPNGEWIKADDAFARVAELEAKLASVNRVIYAAGAPLGSENYFSIREIVAPFGR